MYAGYPALSVDFLSKPSTNRQLPDNMLQFTDIYSSSLNLNINKAFLNNNLPELRPSDVDNNLAVIDSLTSSHNPIVSTNGQNMEPCTSSQLSPVNSSDCNSSVNSTQSSPSTSNNQSSSSSSGEESSPPTLRYGSRSIKGPKGETLIKPSQNYITLISMAILSKPQKKMLLNEIYEYFEEKHPYFKHVKNTSWKNSIRHNLSLNECFIKNGRSDNGQGNYWTIHPACVQDFKKGDFRRRQARRRAKRGAFSQVGLNQNTLDVNYMASQQYQQMPLQDPLLSGLSSGYVPMTSVQATTGVPYNYNTTYPTIPAAHSTRTVSGLTSVQPTSSSYYHHNISTNQQAYNSVLPSHSNVYCSSLPYNYCNSLNQYGGHNNNNTLNLNHVQSGTIAPPTVNAAYLSQMGLFTSPRECMDNNGVRGYMKGYL